MISRMSLEYVFEFALTSCLFVNDAFGTLLTGKTKALFLS